MQTTDEWVVIKLGVKSPLPHKSYDVTETWQGLYKNIASSLQFVLFN